MLCKSTGGRALHLVGDCPGMAEIKAVLQKSIAVTR